MHKDRMSQKYPPVAGLL